MSTTGTTQHIIGWLQIQQRTGGPKYWTARLNDPAVVIEAKAGRPTIDAALDNADEALGVLGFKIGRRHPQGWPVYR